MIQLSLLLIRGWMFGVTECEGQGQIGQRLAGGACGQGIPTVMDCLCLGAEYKSKMARIQQRVMRVLKH